MKYIKIVGVALAALVVVALVVALFMDTEYKVRREIVIDKPSTEVYSYIKYLKNQEHYSKWQLMDPQMKKTYSGTDATIGFVAAWDSQNEDVGKGEQEIKALVDDERVDYELRFIEPFEATEHAYMITEAVNENQTLVIWGFDGKMEYPGNLMLLFMDFEQMIGNDLETGLARLKVIMETQNNR